MKTIWDLKLGEAMEVTDSKLYKQGQSGDNNKTLYMNALYIIRVPGGWLYMFSEDSVFVPFISKLQHNIQVKDSRGEENG